MDDLLDLDFASNCNKSSSTSSNGSRSAQTSGYGGRTNFDYLAAARTTTPSPLPSRTGSPYASSGISPGFVSSGAGKSSTPVGFSGSSGIGSGSGSGLGSGSIPKISKTGSGDGDAFSSLFVASNAASTSSQLSMAERLARDNSLSSSAENGSKSGSIPSSWDTLHPSSNRMNSKSRSSSPALQPTTTERISVHPVNDRKPHKLPEAESWGDFDLLSTASNQKKSSLPSTRTPSTTKQGGDDLMLRVNDEPSHKSGPSRPGHAPSRNRPKDVNMMDDEEFDPSTGIGLLSVDSDTDDRFDDGDGDDILGMLAKPIHTHPISRGSTPTHLPDINGAKTSISSRSIQNRSPPPHVLGRIVEMGFSIQEARMALLATASPTGDWQIEEALEVLMKQSQMENQTDQNQCDVESHHDVDPRRRDGGRRNGHRNQSNDDDWEMPIRKEPAIQPTGRRAREAAAAAHIQAEDEQRSAAGSSQLEERATELLAQASKIGFSVFKSANAYWDTGKAAIQKALDEKLAEASESNQNRHQRSAGGNEKRSGKEADPSQRRPGRPKWMTDDMEESEHAEEDQDRIMGQPAKVKFVHNSADPPPSLFQDDDVEDPVLPQRPLGTRGELLGVASSSSQQTAAPIEYRSPWRRQKVPASPASLPQDVPVQFSARPISRVPTPVPPRPTRPRVPVTSTELETATAHRNSGNDFFKLGRFGDAEQSYGMAILALPARSLALIPLYNNRASARLKNGDEKGAADDCGEVISIILGSSTIQGGRVDVGGLEEDSENMPPEAKDVNLRDHLAKALGRRAKANEVNEKWSKALEDWLVLMTGGEGFAKAGGGAKIISDGVTRCRKAISGDTGSSFYTAPIARTAAPLKQGLHKKPAAARKTTPVVASGNAVKVLQAANDAATAEDDLRFSLKDEVDNRILAWRQGKEGNLRALIASLENVLWPELEWKKVGMHELISDSQLKIRYVKAIAKVHPDKLSVNTTTEQRMIAGGVFAGLNDAWNGSK